MGMRAGVLGVGVDRTLRHLLAGPGGGFPQGLSRGFLIGFVLLMASCLPLGAVREPPTPSPSPDVHSGHYGRDSLRVWQGHADFRRFLYAQVALQLAALAGPFFVLHAQVRLHAGPDFVAGYTATLLFATAFGSLGWGA